jgi:hypothetical protein
MDKEAIMSIPLSTRFQDDLYAWHYERKGSFTVRSAYRMLVAIKKQREDWLEKKPSGSRTEEQKAWTNIWLVKVPSKVHVFVWRLARMSLPRGDVRMRRNMATNGACSICKSPADSWRHSLLDCNMARCVCSRKKKNL